MTLTDAIDKLTPCIDRHQAIFLHKQAPTHSYKYMNLEQAQQLHKTLLMCLAKEGNRELTPSEHAQVNELL